VLVHERRRAGILERLVLHHVAPVARRVADRQQDRAIELARALERLLAPRIPLDGVVLVLEEVGAGLLGEPIRHYNHHRHMLLSPLKRLTITPSRLPAVARGTLTAEGERWPPI
jgi:hypothetical protein